jgi:hypothetical protein
MGGAGSGSHYHWWRSGKKTTVEECLRLDANRWMREGILQLGSQQAGSHRWIYNNGRECSIHFAVTCQKRHRDNRRPVRDAGKEKKLQEGAGKTL